MRIFSCLAIAFAITGCVTSPETGRRAIILTSESEENQLGRQAYAEVLAKERVAASPRWDAILQRVGKRVAAAANKPQYQWEFRLLESKEPNAFCLPGGKVAFYTGIFPYLQNEAALAAVMGHEVAHATLRHGGQRMTMALGTQLGVAGLAALLGGESGERKNLVLAALGIGATVGAVLPFSRSNESEADEVGLKYMARAGYDPREAPRFWERFAKAGGGGMPKFLSTHPPSADRQGELQAQLAAVMPLYESSAKYGIGENL